LSYGEKFDRVGRLNGGDSVTGVEGTDECIGGFDRYDVGDLLNVEESGETGDDVFAEC